MPVSYMGPAASLGWACAHGLAEQTAEALKLGRGWLGPQKRLWDAHGWGRMSSGLHSSFQALTALTSLSGLKRLHPGGALEDR